MMQYTNVDQFKSMFRTSKRPNGSEVSKVMPFETLKALNDTDIEALYVFIRTLPAKQAGHR